jgi:hypothetical protein
MSKVQERYKHFVLSFFFCFFFLFNGSCLLSIFTNKSSDLVVCAHEKIGSLIIHSNNDLFIALKVNYSIGPWFYASAIGASF